MEEKRQLRRAVIASTIGTTIEWYDFFLYSTVTGLVFAKLFFPKSDPLVGLLQAFSIYFIGFLARPVGAAFFGHYGDRIGRKATLIATLLLMGIATFLVGFVPGYDQIGIWGAVLLTILRFVQGFGVGGEWGGSVLIAMEWVRTAGRRGFVASWPQFGVPCGLFLSNVVILLFSGISGSGFVTWGWRIPFFLSIVLIGIGLWIRMSIAETPIFARLVKENRLAETPVRAVIAKQGKEIILSALVRLSEQAPFYIFTAFVFSYAVGELKMDRSLILTAVTFAAIGSLVWIPLSGHLSDVFGRKKMYMLGALVTAFFGFLYFGMLNTMMPAIVFLAILISLIPHDMQYGPQAALIAESFEAPLRYSGSSIGYQLASVIAGGPAPLIATALFATYHSGYAIAWYIVACSVITLLAASAMKDHTNQQIDADQEAAFEAALAGV